MTPRNWQAHRKDFSLQLSLQKDLLPLISSEFIQNFPLVRPYPFPLFDHSKIPLMRPPQEVQDIGQLRPLRNEEDFTVHYNNGNYNGWRLRRLGEFEGPVEFPDLYDLGRLPLWNLTDYGSCQYPRSRCIGERERLKQGAWELEVLSKKTLRQEISTMEW